MPSFSSSLEESLHRALEFANERSHEYATLEHLLLSLVDDRDAAAVMRACNVDLDLLRGKLIDYLDNDLAISVVTRIPNRQPTAVFQRVITALSYVAIVRDREELTGATCWSRFLPNAKATPPILQEQEMTRFERGELYLHVMPSGLACPSLGGPR